MAFFKSRKKVDEPKPAASPAESIEAMRRRARHRLIGAVVLVLVGVVGFPILFDTQPRPVAVDIPIEIPDRHKARPLPPPAAPVAAGKVSPAPAPAPKEEVVTDSRPTAAATSEPKEEIITDSKPKAPVTAPKVAAAESAKPAAKAEAEKKPEPKPETRTEAKAEDPAKARALLDAKAVEAGGRYVVQVGAYAEEAKARQAQQKLERAGLRTYRQVADTDDGKRIRVRAGPFASKAEADEAARKIKGLDLPVRVLTL